MKPYLVSSFFGDIRDGDILEVSRQDYSTMWTTSSDYWHVEDVPDAILRLRVLTTETRWSGYVLCLCVRYVDPYTGKIGLKIGQATDKVTMLRFEASA